MEGVNRLEELMLFPMFVSAMTKGGYVTQQFPKISRRKERPATPITCHRCGVAGRVTLYKDSEGMICKKCRSELSKVVTP